MGVHIGDTARQRFRRDRALMPGRKKSTFDRRIFFGRVLEGKICQSCGILKSADETVSRRRIFEHSQIEESLCDGCYKRNFFVWMQKAMTEIKRIVGCATSKKKKETG